MKDIEDLFEEKTSICDDVWLLSLILLMFSNNDTKSKTIINIYINGDKVGE